MSSPSHPLKQSNSSIPCGDREDEPSSSVPQSKGKDVKVAFAALYDFISSLSEANRNELSLRKYKILLQTVKNCTEEGDSSMTIGTMAANDHPAFHLDLFCRCFGEEIGRDVLLKKVIETGDVDESVTVSYTPNISVPLGALINKNEAERDTIRNHILNVLIKWTDDDQIGVYLKEMMAERQKVAANSGKGTADFLSGIIGQVKSAVDSNKPGDGSPPDLGTMITSVLGSVLPGVMSEARGKMESGELSKEGLTAGLPGILSQMSFDDKKTT